MADSKAGRTAAVAEGEPGKTAAAADHEWARTTAAADRLTPRAREIVTAARELLEESGPTALTLRALADRLGIKAPSSTSTSRTSRPWRSN